MNRYQSLQRRIREKESEISGLLGKIENIDKVNDGKNKRLAELKSRNDILKLEMKKQEQESNSIIITMQTKFDYYKSTIQQLADENQLLFNKFHFCKNSFIFLLFLLLITPGTILLNRTEGMDFFEANQVSEPIDLSKFVEIEEYDALRFENEGLLNQITSLNNRIMNRLSEDSDSYSRIQMLQEQLRYTMQQNQHLVHQRNICDLQKTQINKMSETIMNNNMELLHYKQQLRNAYQEIERLKARMHFSGNHTTDAVVNDTQCQTRLVTNNASVIDRFIGDFVSVMNRKDTIEILVIFIEWICIAAFQYIAYRIFCIIWDYSLERNCNKKWNRGANGRLSSTLSQSYRLARSL